MYSQGEFQFVEYSLRGIQRYLETEGGDSTTGGDGGEVDQGGNQAVKMTRLSRHPFQSNKVRLSLTKMAYNLGIRGGNPWRRLVLSTRIDNWSLRFCGKGWGRPETGSVLLAAAFGKPSEAAVRAMAPRIASLPVATC